MTCITLHIMYINYNQGKGKSRAYSQEKPKRECVPNEEHLLTPSRVTTAVRMKTKGKRKARMRIVWKRVR